MNKILVSLFNSDSQSVSGTSGSLGGLLNPHGAHSCLFWYHARSAMEKSPGDDILFLTDHYVFMLAACKNCQVFKDPSEVMS